MVSSISNVSAEVGGDLQSIKSNLHLTSDPSNLTMENLGHSEEVETISIEAMEVDDQEVLSVIFKSKHFKI